MAYADARIQISLLVNHWKSNDCKRQLRNSISHESDKCIIQRAHKISGNNQVHSCLGTYKNCHYNECSDENL